MPLRLAFFHSQKLHSTRIINEHSSLMPSSVAPSAEAEALGSSRMSPGSGSEPNISAVVGFHSSYLVGSRSSVDEKSPYHSLRPPGFVIAFPQNHSPIAEKAQNTNIPNEHRGAYHLSGVRRQHPTIPRTNPPSDNDPPQR